jgi:uncharacterized protein YdeI (YjbR/CyaY-like superfamily)
MPAITEIFYPHHRGHWRDWLQRYHREKAEIWLRMFRKDSGKPSLPYDDLVEECLCFGWIDGVVKKLDTESRVQRITPRRQRSYLSELNRQRVWKLQRQGLIQPGALDKIADQVGHPADPLEVPDWVAEQLRADAEIWDAFHRFPYFYRRLKIGWIAEARNRRAEAQKRLDYLIKNTREGKRYGTQPLAGLTPEDFGRSVDR